MAALNNQLSSPFSGSGFPLRANFTSDELIDALELGLSRVLERPAGGSLPLVRADRRALMALALIRTARDFFIISDWICRDFHLGPDQLQSRYREQRIAFVRQLAIFLCRKITGAPFDSIGDHFSRDRATAIHPYRVID